MQLKLYLTKNNLTVTEFAELINYSRTHLSAVINGTQNASPKLAKLVQKYTNGEVTAQEVMGES